jgi:hypothetical protein
LVQQAGRHSVNKVGTSGDNKENECLQSFASHYQVEKDRGEEYSENTYHIGDVEYNVFPGLIHFKMRTDISIDSLVSILSMQG